MPSIITTKFRVANAQAFRDSISDPASSYYLMIGRNLPWENEISAPSPTDSVQQQLDCWGDLMAAKRITQTDTVLCVPRYDWEPGVVYDQYGDNTIPGDKFYVITDEYKVFKCLNNNGGIPSVNKPSVAEAQKTKPFRTAEGYLWKYMCTVSVADAMKFLTPDFIPIRPDPDVVSSSVSGQIYRVEVVNGGSGYVTPPLVIIEGPNTVNTAVPVTFDAANNNVIWNNHGLGVGGSVRFELGSGGVMPSGLNANQVYYVATRTNNTFTVSTTRGGSIVDFTTNGTATINAVPLITAVASIDLGEVTSIEMVDGFWGEGFDIARVTITGGGGTGAVARAVLAPFGGHGSDVENELFATFCAISNALTEDLGGGDFPTQNDYRRIFLTKDPFIFGTSTIANGPTYRGTYGMQIIHQSGLTQIPTDTIATGGTSGCQISIVGATQVSSTPLVYNVLYTRDMSLNYTQPQVGESINLSGGGTWLVSSITNPELEPFTGSIIFIEQRRPIMRAPDQTELIEVLIEF